MTEVIDAPSAVEGYPRRTNNTYRIEVAGDGPRAATERAIHVPEVAEPIIAGVRPSYEATYGAAPGQFEPRATTVDIFVGAVATCMHGTFALALGARGVEAGKGELTAHATSTVAQEKSGVVYVERIDVRMTTALGEEHHDTLRKVARVFEQGCWLSQTLVGSRCTVTFELDLG